MIRLIDLHSIKMITDKFCLLDLLELLMMDDEAYFLPHHPSFHYKRIGVKKEGDPQYPTFTSYNNPIKLDQLTWHNTRLNLSVLAKIEGQVQLPVNKFNLSTLNTFIYRNYTLIKDGKLNINILPVLISEETVKTLIQHDVVKSKSDVYLIDLTTLPIINQQTCENMTSAIILANQSMTKLQLDCHLKVLKSRMVEMKELLSSELEVYLASIGIKDGCYSPPAKTENQITFEMVKAFAIKIQGSILPKVEDVMKGKNLNLCGKFMKEMIDVQDEDLVEQYEITKHHLKLITSSILKTKFSLILCHQWVDREEVIVDKTKVTFSLEDLKVYIDK